MRAIGALAAGAVIALAALVAPGWAVDPVHDSLVYCKGSLDGGASGVITDREHTIVVGDRPLPPGVRRRRMRIDGISTPVMEAGPRRAREVVVFVHGNPGSSRDFDSLVAETGKFARAVASGPPVDPFTVRDVIASRRPLAPGTGATSDIPADMACIARDAGPNQPR